MVVTLALELDPDPRPPIGTTPPDDGLVVTDDKAVEVDEALALLLAEADPPVRTIIPV